MSFEEENFHEGHHKRKAPTTKESTESKRSEKTNIKGSAFTFLSYKLNCHFSLGLSYNFFSLPFYVNARAPNVLNNFFCSFLIKCGNIKDEIGNDNQRRGYRKEKGWK